jgi:(p)ppGpp synthase/HD superfamily hydrolase
MKLVDMKQVQFKCIRLNTNLENAAKLHKVQDEFKKKHHPARISLEALANMAIELGIDSISKKLNLTEK